MSRLQNGPDCEQRSFSQTSHGASTVVARTIEYATPSESDAAIAAQAQEPWSAAATTASAPMPSGMHAGKG
jgi:hypothetical protein